MAMHDVLVTVGADISDYTRSLGQAKAQMEGFNSTMETSNNSMDKQQKVSKTRADRIQEDNEEIGKSYFKTSGILASVSASIAGSLAVPIKRSSSFEDAFVGVEKTVQGTPKEMKKLEDGIRSMATEMPKSAEEISGVAEQAGRLGIEKDNILSFSKTMTMMGDASDMSASQAAQSMARLMNIMGTSKDKSENLGSAITHMGNNVAASESEILDLSRRLAVSGNQIGLTESEVVGFASTMKDLGLRTESSGTAMQKTFLKMDSAVAEGGEELDKFAKVAGVSADEFTDSYKNDAKEAVLSFVSGLGKVEESGGNVSTVLDDLGLNNERTRTSLLALSSSSDELADNIGLSNKAFKEGTALSEEADRRYKTLSSTFKKLWNSVQEILIVLGQPLASVLKGMVNGILPVVQWVGKLTDWFIKLNGTASKVAGILAGVVAALIALSSGLFAAAAGWALFGTKFVATVKLIKAWTSVLASLTTRIVALKALMNPTSLAIAGVGAVIAGIIVGVKKFSKNQDKLNDSTENVTESSKELRKEIEKSSGEHEKKTEKIKKESKSQDELYERIKELTDQEHRSREDKAELSDLSDELNEKVDGLSLTYNKYSDSLSRSTDEVEDFVKQSQNQDKLEDTQSRINKVMKQRKEVEDKLRKVSTDRRDLEEKLGGIASKNTPKYKALQSRLNSLKEEEGKLKNSDKDLGDEKRNLANKIEKYQGRIDESIRESVKNQTLTYEDLEKDQKEVFDEMSNSYENVKDTATDMFEKIPDEAEQSFEEMKDILEHNLEAVDDWNDNLDEIASKGASDAFVEHLKDLGPEHAAAVKEIADQGEDKIRDMDETYGGIVDSSMESMTAGFEADEDVMAAVKSIASNSELSLREAFEAANMGKLGKGAIDDVGSGIDQSADNIRNTVSKIPSVNMLNPLASSLAEQDFEGQGSSAVQGFLNGIDSKLPDVEGYSDNIGVKTGSFIKDRLEIGSPSKLMFRYGDDTVQGFIDGIDSNSDGPTSSTGKMLDMMLGRTETGLSDVEGRNRQGTSTIGRILEGLNPIAGGAMSSMLSALTKGGKGQASYMSGLPATLKSKLTGMASSFRNTASNAMSGLLGGLSSMTGGVISKAKSIASSVAGSLKSALKIGSPSKLIRDEVGKMIGSGLIEGMDSETSSIQRMAGFLSEYATPETPKLADVKGKSIDEQGRRFSSRIKSDISGINVDRRNEEGLLSEIRNELRNQKQMIVELDAREVGMAVQPHVNEKNALDEKGRFFK